MTADSLARMRLIVTGPVQGVFFRVSAAEQAASLALTGFVRNLSDGSLELVAEGARSQLEHLYAWAQRGPKQAHVDRIHVEWSEFRREGASSLSPKISISYSFLRSTQISILLGDL